MIFKFGDYEHAANEVDVTNITHQRMYSPRNKMAFLRKTLTMHGHICESGQTTITASLEALEQGYLREWHSVGLYHDDGTPSAHVLKSGTNAGCVNAVRLLTLDYFKDDGSEYATGRSFRAVFQADYIADYGKYLVESEIYSYEETLAVIGTGGRDWEYVPQFYGNPIFQVNCNVTPQRVIQSGQQVGMLAHLLPPQPYWPYNVHDNQTMVEYGTAQKPGPYGQNLLYPSKWRYHMSFVPGDAGFMWSGAGSVPFIPSGLPWTPQS